MTKLGPYDLNTIYTGDARILAESIPDNSVDLIFTDPPFGTNTYESDIPVVPETWQELRRTGKNLFAIWGYPKNLFQWSRHFDDLILLDYIIWYKYNELVTSVGLSKAHQDIAIWGTSHKQVRANLVREPYSKNIAVQKWFNKGNGNLTGRVKRTLPNLDGKRCTDVWSIPAPGALFNAKYRLHPNEKPEDAVKRIILLLTNPGDLILDPFTGSGTIPACCKMLDRNYLAFELNGDMATIARNRVENTQLSLPGINDRLSNLEINPSLF